MIDWRVWLKATLDANVALVAVVPAARIIGASGTVEVPSRPFIEIRAGELQRGPFPGSHRQMAQVWVHDDPGDYMAIDSIIELVKNALCGVVREAPVHVANGVTARWLSDSTELVDDGYHTITRNTNFQLNGKEAS